jgi:hypothetical protein
MLSKHGFHWNLIDILVAPGHWVFFIDLVQVEVEVSAVAFFKDAH